MYQWVENSSRENNNQTVYTYSQEWRSSTVNSNAFQDSSRHSNPTQMPFQDLSITAEQVCFGQFELAPSQKSMLNSRKPLTLTHDEVQKVQVTTENQLKSLNYDILRNEGDTFMARKMSYNQDVIGNMTSFRAMGSSVGDLRISFYVV